MLSEARSISMAVFAGMFLLAGPAISEEPATPQPVMATIKAHPALWVVHSPTATAYLFGSIHILPPNIDWRSEPVQQALAASDVFVFEAPLGDSGKEETKAFVQANGVLPADLALPSLLSESARRDYKDAIALTHVPPEQLVHLRPWLAALVMEGHLAESMHYSPDSGVDRQVWAYAKAQNKSVDSFETIDEQLRLLMPKDQKLEVAEFDASMKELSTDANEVGELLDAWKDGHMNKVADLMNTGLKSAPGAMKLLIDDRNGRWVTKISAMLAQHHTYFITVGAGHIAGPRGLPALLAAKGYQVEQIAPR
jgi:uncharacterized protein YbaP (TraB family)